MQGTTNKLAGFIALSMIAHGLLLFVHNQHETHTRQVPIGNQILSVTLASHENSSTENITPINTDEVFQTLADNKQSGIDQQASNSPIISNHQITPTAINEIGQVTNQESTTELDKAIETSKESDFQDTYIETNRQLENIAFKIKQQNMQQNFLLGQIKNRLSQYMNYPIRARKRGWQGSVMIGFSVDKQGFLRNIHLTQTSGYTLLDNAALTAVKKVNHVPVNQWGSVFQPVALQLPVIYRLTNS